MARTSLTVTTSAAAGTVLPALGVVDMANGNMFPNTGREAVEVANGGPSPITVTIITNGTYAVGAVAYPIADLTVSVTNGTSKVIGPFDKTLFNDANAQVQLDWSADTLVTCRVVALGTA